MKNIVLIQAPEKMNAISDLVLKKYNIFAVTTLKQAIILCHQKKISLFIIKTNLPDGCGFDFCRQLSQMPRFKKTPKVLTFSKSDLAKRVYGFSCGADDYLAEPFTQAELAAKIDQLTPIKKEMKQSFL